MFSSTRTSVLHFSTMTTWALLLAIVINVFDLCTSTMMGRIPAGVILGPRYSNRLPGKIKQETETTVVAFDPSTVVVTTQQWHWENFFRCAIAGAFSCASVHSLLLPFQAFEATKGQALRVASRNVRRMISEGFGVSLPLTISTIYSHPDPYPNHLNTCHQVTFTALTIDIFFFPFDPYPTNKHYTYHQVTFTGYFFQGAAKFGFYDLFKGNIIQMAFGEQNTKLPDSIRIPILMLSSAAAEVIACWALSPMEVTRMQMMMVATTPGQHKGMAGTLAAMVKNEGFRSLFKGLPLLLVRQVCFLVIQRHQLCYLIPILLSPLLPLLLPLLPLLPPQLPPPQLLSPLLPLLIFFPNRNHHYTHH